MRMQRSAQIRMSHGGTFRTEERPGRQSESGSRTGGEAQTVDQLVAEVSSQIVGFR